MIVCLASQGCKGLTPPIVMPSMRAIQGIVNVPGKLTLKLSKYIQEKSSFLTEIKGNN